MLEKSIENEAAITQFVGPYIRIPEVLSSWMRLFQSFSLGTQGKYRDETFKLGLYPISSWTTDA